MPNLIHVNPTRQELLKLKAHLKTAQHGHKLLKEKRDGLMKEFLSIVRQAQSLRENIEKKLSKGFHTFLLAAANMRPEEMKEALLIPAKKILLKVQTKNVMSVSLPQFQYEEEGDFLAYSLASTPALLDEALMIFSDALKMMVELAAVEHSAKLLAEEIEKTRRRVNALEHVSIPAMQETIKYITTRLEEQERGARIVLMKIKEEIVREKSTS